MNTGDRVRVDGAGDVGVVVGFGHIDATERRPSYSTAMQEVVLVELDHGFWQNGEHAQQRGMFIKVIPVTRTSVEVLQ